MKSIVKDKVGIVSRAIACVLCMIIVFSICLIVEGENSNVVESSEKGTITKSHVKWKKKWQYAKFSAVHSNDAVLFKSNAVKKKRLTIAINAGHGSVKAASRQTLCHPDGSAKVTGGSTAAGSKYATAASSGTSMLNGMSEAKANLKVARRVKNTLLEAGYDVLMIRNKKDVDLDNIARTVIANNNADCHIAIHYDSSTSDKGAFAITVPNVKSYINMEPVKSHWKKHNKLGRKLIAGLSKAGVKIYGTGKMAIDLTQTSYSTIPSIDLEVGDRKSSVNEKSINKIAKGIKKGLALFF